MIKLGKSKRVFNFIQTCYNSVPFVFFSKKHKYVPEKRKEKQLVKKLNFSIHQSKMGVIFFLRTTNQCIFKQDISFF